MLLLHGHPLRVLVCILEIFLQIPLGHGIFLFPNFCSFLSFFQAYIRTRLNTMEWQGLQKTAAYQLARSIPLALLRFPMDDFFFRTALPFPMTVSQQASAIAHVPFLSEIFHV